MCGASSEQHETYAAQSDFYRTMTAQYKTVFGEQQEILKTLTDAFTPILAAGPDQEGYGPEERAMLESQATEGVAENYAQASESMEENLAARGGGNVAVPSGADEGRRAQLAAKAAQTRSALQTQNTVASHDVGRRLWGAAASGLSGVAGQQNPIGFAEATTGAGNSASKTASDIAAADNSVMSSVMGMVGGLAGAAVGNLNVGPFGKK